MGPLYPYNAADICPVWELSIADEEGSGRSRNRHVNLRWYVWRIRQKLDTLRRELPGRKSYKRKHERAGNITYTEAIVVGKDT